jgi:hypothetical protein
MSELAYHATESDSSLLQFKQTHPGLRAVSEPREQHDLSKILSPKGSAILQDNSRYKLWTRTSFSRINRGSSSSCRTWSPVHCRNEDNCECNWSVLQFIDSEPAPPTPQVDTREDPTGQARSMSYTGHANLSSSIVRQHDTLDAPLTQHIAQNCVVCFMT